MLIDDARKYLSRGWQVVPIAVRKKRPTLFNWPALRLTEEQLPKHFKKGNIGIILGEPSGDLVDVDLDHPLAVQLADDYLPTTAAVFGRAGKPRSHRLYVAVGAATHQRKHAELGMIVELRSTGHQTVFPGSVHESGELIEWASEGQPAVVASTALRRGVDALADEVCRRLGVELTVKAAITPTKDGSQIKKGGRKLTLVSYAGTMRRVGMTENEMLAALRTINNDRCVPPLEDSEIQDVARSVAKYPPSDLVIGHAPYHAPPEPFPVEALPDPVGPYAREASEAIGCDVSFVALPLLASLASAIGNVRRIRLKADWTEPSILWTAVVADSGQHKSPALEKATAMLKEIQNAALDEYQGEMEVFQTALADYDDKIQAWRKGKPQDRTGERPIKPEEPIARRYVVSDRPSRRWQVCCDRPRGVCCFSAMSWPVGSIPLMRIGVERVATQPIG